MALVWLWVAVCLYGLGLAYSLALLANRGERIARVAIPAVSLGLVFHFVSLVEFIVHEQLTPASIEYSESLLAFALMVLFMIVRVRYKTTSHGMFVFPLAFFLTFASIIARRPLHLEDISPVFRSWWLFAHIALIFTGYAALFLSFGASLLYLLQASRLKSKNPGPREGLASRLPALEVLDEIGYRALLLGFPFMTLGLVMGAVVAQARFGSTYFTDPKVMLSLLMWAVYMVLLYTRWSSGWRGRRAAYLATFAFLAALVAWGANYFSYVHNVERVLRS